METNDENPVEIRNGFTRILITKNITVLNLNGKDLSTVDDIELPANLIDLNLSHNKFESVPAGVTKLRHLKSLNISFNEIVNFDDTPAFCHTLESLNIANNKLNQAPLWVWSASPQKLTELDISYNYTMNISPESVHFNKLLKYKTALTIVKINNCGLRRSIEILGTFPKVKKLDLGTEDLSRLSGNFVHQVPCKGIDECREIERLNLRYTQLYTIHSTIDLYKHLVEINLSDNSLSGLPNEFCNLTNLEICVLSFNNIFYLPDDVIKLKKLTTLIVDNNKLYTLPENLFKMPCLIKLDIYNNGLYEIAEGYEKLEELDVAQNYFEEPQSGEYENMKNKLRSNMSDRFDGSKTEIEESVSRCSRSFSEDEELLEDSSNNSNAGNEEANRPPSSIEDWDSDDYWEPGWNLPHQEIPTTSRWMAYSNRMMAEGNFCPYDSHQLPILGTINKLCIPQVYESDSQFDDYSSDDS